MLWLTLLLKCIFLTLYFQTSNANKHKLLPKLLELINSKGQHGKNLYVKPHVRELNDHKQNRVLIKRKIPKGESSKFEYLPPNMYYIPLFRIDGEKYMRSKRNRKRSGVKHDSQLDSFLEPWGSFLRKGNKKNFGFVSDNDMSLKKWRSRSHGRDRKSDKKDLTRIFIESLLKKIDPSLHLGRKLTLEDYKKKYLRLRDYSFLKSGEDSTPGDPKTVEDDRTVEESKELKKPEYTIWDFWQYSKALPQDECPDRQIKVGNVCIKSPPH